MLSIVPRERRRAYDVRRVISLVVDRGSFFELGPLQGRSLVTGLARLTRERCDTIVAIPMAGGVESLYLFEEGLTPATPGGKA